MMLTLWPSYILIFLSAILGLLIPIVLPQIWRLGQRMNRKPLNHASNEESTSRLSAPIAIRFHLAALLFVGFLGFALLIIPLLFSTHSENGMASAITLIGIVVPMLIALFYGLRKGDLSWSSPKYKEDELP